MITLMPRERADGQTSVRSLTALNLRCILGLRNFGVVLIFAVAPCVLGGFESQDSAFRDNLDVLSNIMVSPVILVFPLLITLVVNTRLFGEIGGRYISATRTRAAIGHYIGAKIISSAVAGGIFAALVAFVPVLTAFIVWPILGNPSVSPDLYGMSVEEAAADATSRFSFTELLAFGHLPYSFAYILWVGLSGATYSAMGVLSLLVARQKVVGLLAPFLVYIAQSVFFSLSVGAHSTLIFSTFPFGLTQNSLVSLLPNAVLIISIGFASMLVVKRAPLLYRVS